jgi:ribosome-associated protein
MIIASGRSDRQVKAIADKLVEAVKKLGQRPLGVEGRQQGEWVLVDLGDVIVHVMHPTSRAYYQLEKLWEHDTADPETYNTVNQTKS